MCIPVVNLKIVLSVCLVFVLFCLMIYFLCKTKTKVLLLSPWGKPHENIDWEVNWVMVFEVSCEIFYFLMPQKHVFAFDEQKCH